MLSWSSIACVSLALVSESKCVLSLAPYNLLSLVSGSGVSFIVSGFRNKVCFFVFVLESGYISLAPVSESKLCTSLVLVSESGCASLAGPFTLYKGLRKLTNSFLP